MRLQGKKALVTGASRGIGRAIALRLAQEGCTVGVHYRDKIEEAQAVTDEIQAMNGMAHLFQADLQNVEELIKLGTNVWDALQGIDILVNNAGISYKKHFLDYNIEDVDAFTNVNFRGTLFLTQTIARKMVETQTEGSIYTITSVNGIRPGLGLSVYGATKGALETLMKGVAMELAPHCIRVNTLAVGAVETDMNKAVRENPTLLQAVKEGIPLGRFAQPEEIAETLVSLLASDSYLTGASITLDGGLLLMRGYGKLEKYNNGVSI
jgi:NAD(P)-dependent dehydrogenase (short-subunit alcohol dehydrogenase family)